MLVEININDSWLNEAASILNFKIGRVPLMYLGLPIGGDTQQLLLLEPVLLRIKSRLHVGGVDCGRERRSWKVSVGIYCFILPCKLIFLIIGISILTQVTGM